MKLVLVGWCSALISFGIGFMLGRRARRRDMVRDAMLQASMTLAAYSSIKDGLPKMLDKDGRLRDDDGDE